MILNVLTGKYFFSYMHALTHPLSLTHTHTYTLSNVYSANTENYVLMFANTLAIPDPIVLDLLHTAHPFTQCFFLWSLALLLTLSNTVF